MNRSIAIKRNSRLLSRSCVHKIAFICGHFHMEFPSDFFFTSFFCILYFQFLAKYFFFLLWFFAGIVFHSFCFGIRFVWRLCAFDFAQNAKRDIVLINDFTKYHHFRIDRWYDVKCILGICNFFLRVFSTNGSNEKANENQSERACEKMDMKNHLDFGEVFLINFIGVDWRNTKTIN